MFMVHIMQFGGVKVLKGLAAETTRVYPLPEVDPYI